VQGLNSPYIVLEGLENIAKWRFQRKIRRIALHSKAVHLINHLTNLEVEGGEWFIENKIGRYYLFYWAGQQLNPM